jgi:hypothetical protein
MQRGGEKPNIGPALRKLRLSRHLAFTPALRGLTGIISGTGIDSDRGSLLAALFLLATPRMLPSFFGRVVCLEEVFQDNVLDIFELLAVLLFAPLCSWPDPTVIGVYVDAP